RVGGQPAQQLLGLGRGAGPPDGEVALQPGQDGLAHPVGQQPVDGGGGRAGGRAGRSPESPPSRAGGVSPPTSAGSRWTARTAGPWRSASTRNMSSSSHGPGRSPWAGRIAPRWGGGGRER